ncbi:ImmA/IrrE family metallo-endopeptidase [Macrococcoides bohemicum]|uniref:ImmA/IrrE family metallo-endopeptidase n=1 Tax=Macrococcoides bohemicum TaxID=1903056 RepID=UPI00105A0DC0|nr:ImmA/IrrE family metallo-endopeptidase [Macrococcus bohemicus]TDL35723.1 ImmA/IrrE family metallo-endopeptidase [Macrococcus bohemicus]
MDYEELEKLAGEIPIIFKNDMPKGLSGCYKDGVIFLRDGLPQEKYIEILSEELGHHYTSVGNITDYRNINNAKQELKARRYGIEMIITLDGIIECWKQHIRTVFEMALHFNVTPEFIYNAIEHYKMKYGLSTEYGEYLIRFEPLHVYKYKKI